MAHSLEKRINAIRANILSAAADQDPQKIREAADAIPGFRQDIDEHEEKRRTDIQQDIEELEHKIEVLHEKQRQIEQHAQSVREALVLALQVLHKNQFSPAAVKMCEQHLAGAIDNIHFLVSVKRRR